MLPKTLIFTLENTRGYLPSYENNGTLVVFFVSIIQEKYQRKAVSNPKIGTVKWVNWGRKSIYNVFVYEATEISHLLLDTLK